MPKLSSSRLISRARGLKLMLFDVDGILTDGLLFHFVDTSGKLVELKGINTQDSIALVWLAEAGIKTGIISGRYSRGIEERAKMLKMTYIYQHRLDKKTVFAEICRDARVKTEHALFMGDDLPDIPALKLAGLGVTVGNARPQTKTAAHWITRANGGQGAVREVAELVLRAKGLWKGLLDKYEA